MQRRKIVADAVSIGADGESQQDEVLNREWIRKQANKRAATLALRSADVGMLMCRTVTEPATAFSKLKLGVAGFTRNRYPLPSSDPNITCATFSSASTRMTSALRSCSLPSRAGPQPPAGRITGPGHPHPSSPRPPKVTWSAPDCTATADPDAAEHHGTEMTLTSAQQ